MSDIIYNFPVTNDFFPKEGETEDVFKCSCDKGRTEWCDVCMFGARKVAYYANRDVANRKCGEATSEYLKKCFAEIDAIESLEERVAQFVVLVKVTLEEPPYASYTCIYSVAKDIREKFYDFPDMEPLHEVYNDFRKMYDYWL